MGDFGALADWAPRDIRAALSAAGLECPSAHVMWRELDTSSLDRTLEWLNGVGVPRAVLASVPVTTGADREAWLQTFDRLNALGECMHRAGLRFAIHTQVNLWASAGDMRPADELVLHVDPRLCAIEYDPSGALMYGIDPAACLQLRPDAFWALHLRDGRRPAQELRLICRRCRSARARSTSSRCLLRPVPLRSSGTSSRWKSLQRKV